MILLNRRQTGFSLVEMAVALVVVALLGVLVARLLPLGNELLDAERQQNELAQAEQALLGYMRSQSRLPAADGNGDGRADGATDGWLPVSDLGLPRRMRLHYQVQAALIVPAGAGLFEPVLAAADQPAASDNGLDFCMQLLLNQRGEVAIAGLGVPVAYYLGHSGMRGHARSDADAQWSPGAQALPGEPATAGSLATIAAGPGELAARLACPDRLARTQGSAQGAYAAHSALRMTEFNLQFREFDINIAETIREQAKVARDLAAYALAESITNQAISIVMLASGWPPDGATMAAGAKLAAKAAFDIGKNAYALKTAQDDYNEAVSGVEDARQRRNQVSAFRDRIRTLHAEARDTTVDLARAGLNQ
ncbi:prepilin-type N-terminal cleavage/methylation domain-containing protein [Luteimonas sp BLCC-B24]|uniref:prepilin-type N-terminal cleavage/methylation domain-containing protein n=1 Tax=Luteimonas sp. BLCC-B24 TaxID=3025317 RepID=UPI00234C4795|nr:prepilin-type N-terminal cleavage/methylation domain-containing protein [Luteimonas sp. BLCC-B24]MDC7805929.1 prepilin-type N-terminal cleavage/methylation domain-containing protein [Luteimonas sp. BLCC-B24]